MYYFIQIVGTNESTTSVILKIFNISNKIHEADHKCVAWSWTPFTSCDDCMCSLSYRSQHYFMQYLLQTLHSIGYSTPPPLSQLSYRSQSQLPFLSYTYWKQTHICQLLGLRHNQLWQRCVCVCMCVHVGVGELAGKFTLAVCTCWSVQQLCTITPLYNITGDSNIKV